MTHKDRLTAWLIGAGAVLDLGGVTFDTERFRFVAGSLQTDAAKLRNDGRLVQADFMRATRKEIGSRLGR